MSLGKSKLSAIKVLISKTLIDSHISYDESILGYRKHRYELVSERKTTQHNLYTQRISNQSNYGYFRTTAAHKFRTRLGFKQDDVI